MLGNVARRSLCLGRLRFLRPALPPIFFSNSNYLQTSQFSSTAGWQGAQNQPLKQWALYVSPFTCLRAQLSCSIYVSPLDPHDFPEADRAFITLHGLSEGQGPCHVRYDEESKELMITGGEGGSELAIHLAVPIKSNLFITTEGQGHVHISEMECDICKVSTKQGNCNLHSVKAHQVEVRSLGGHVTGLGTIHGNVDIITRGESAVDVKKLQGTTMNISSEHGSVKVKAIYAESCSISSYSGKVELGHVHGSAMVKNESGDTIIDGSNSFLKISSHSGDIDVYVGDGASVDIISEEGAVCVRVPSSVQARVQLCGTSVDISSEVVFEESEKHQASGQTTVKGFVNGEFVADLLQVKARTTGSVRLMTQSWFESLKLRN